MARSIFILFCAHIGIFWAANAAAVSLDIRSSPENQLDVSLNIRQSSLLLQNSPYSLATDFSGIGFQLIDIPPKTPIQLGLAAGYAFIEQQAVLGLNNTELHGGYISLLARIPVLNLEQWSSEIILRYSYMAAKNNSETQKTRLRWNHARIEVDLNYLLTNYLSATVGAVAGLVDGRLTGSGDNNVTLTLEAEKNTAGIIGVNYHIANDQKVTLQIQRGYMDSVAIQFQRTF